MSLASTDTNIPNITGKKIISLVIAGINGRMGRATIEAIQADPLINVVGAFGRPGAPYVGKTVQELIGATAKNANGLIVSDNLDQCLANLKTMPDVLIDNTEADCAVKHSIAAIKKGIRPVIGTSGLTESHLKELRGACAQARIGALVVPNFSVVLF